MHPNETRIYLAVLTAVFVLATLIIFYIVSIIHYQKSKITDHRRRLEAEINLLEKERSRIASDLHDDLGSSLSAIKLRLQCLEPNKEDMVVIQESETYIDEAMAKLRRISFNMMPVILQRNGLPDAIFELADVIAFSGRIKVNCTCDFDPGDNDARIHIYRIVQEALNNILKHAQASVVNISFRKTKETICLHISDNGTGFDKSEKTKAGLGQGLRNIMARVDLLKAKIYLTTEPGKGVDYLIEIPEK